MSLVDRLTTLFKADAHGVVDSLEDRRLVLRQCLRDAEGELAAKRTRLAGLRDEARGLADERERLTAKAESLDADVELALARGQDELARFSARRLLEIRREHERVETRLERISGESGELEERVRAHEGELSSLKNRVREALDRESRAQAAGPAGGVADEEVELELLRRRAGKEGGE